MSANTKNDPILIGITGSFGSGCTELFHTIETLAPTDLKVETFKISDEIKEEAIKRGLSNPDRKILQDIGNELRKEKGNAYWINRVLSKTKFDSDKLIVIDGIRNLGEVNELHKYARFFLVAVDCSTENRWQRLKDKIYKGDRQAFERDDRRDKSEGLPYGQQVLACVEQADIIFVNEEKFPTESRIKEEIKKRFNDDLLLITERKPRIPNLMETIMAVSSNLALQSRCIKRRVGAVICSKQGYIVSAAYNEVPYPEKSCYDEYVMCYRDFYRKDLKEKLINSFTCCPNCHIKFSTKPTDVDFCCPKCNAKISDYFPPIKALDKCRALHAEEAAILQTPQFQIEGSILYTTTFPCLQCAKRILYAGIKEVIYIDPYPEEEAIEFLEKGGVKTTKFDGVKAQAFYKFFYPHREWLEKQILKKIER